MAKINLARLLKESEIKKLLADDTPEEEKDYSSIISSIISFISESRLGSDPLAVPDEGSSVGSLSLIVPAFLALLSSAGIIITVPLAIMAIDLLTDIADTYDNWLDDETINPDSPLYDFHQNLRKLNILVGDIWNYNNSDYYIDKKDGSYDLSDILKSERNSRLFNIVFGNALNYGLSEDKFCVKRKDDGTHDFSKIIAFQTPSGDIEYLSDVMPNVLSQDLWELIRRE